MSGLTAEFRPEVRRVLPAVIAVRFVINVGMRMGYTFLPAFARGTGMSIGATSAVLSARELTALSAPLTGRASDRFGAMRVLTVGAFVAGAGLVVSAFGAPGLIVGFIVFGFGRTAQQVAVNAWVGSVVAYQRRGRATGLVELTWGGAALIGLPVAGLMIDDIGWWSAPATLGLAALLLAWRVHATAEGVGAERSDTPTRKPLMTKRVVAALATNGAMTGSAQFLFLVHGLWLEDTYGLDTAEIGLAILAVGAIEVVATMGSARLTDRLGKRRSMMAGTGLMTAVLFAFSIHSAPPLWLGLLMLVTAFLGFEFGIVSGLPLISELDPEARAQMVGRSVSTNTLTRAVVTLFASALYLANGFAVSMAVAGCVGLAALLIAALFMVEPEH